MRQRLSMMLGLRRMDRLQLLQYEAGLWVEQMQIWAGTTLSSYEMDLTRCFILLSIPNLWVRNMVIWRYKLSLVIETAAFLLQHTVVLFLPQCVCSIPPIFKCVCNLLSLALVLHWIFHWEFKQIQGPPQYSILRLDIRHLETLWR